MSGVGITFDETHSFRDWGLKLKKIVVGIPKAKTEYVSVPGMNGDLDLTEAQNGGVKYEMRSLKFSFGVRNCTYDDWSGLVSQIASELQGKKKQIVLDTDREYYYVGRCEIDPEKTNDVTGDITISCTCEPYKYDINSSGKPWIWDIFNFESGVIRNTSNLKSNAASTWQAVYMDGWFYNETLKIISDADMQVKYNGKIFDIYAGENAMYDLFLTQGKNTLYFQGVGTITLIHRGGML